MAEATQTRLASARRGTSAAHDEAEPVDASRAFDEGAGSRSGPSLRERFDALPQMWRWGLKFELFACVPGALGLFALGLLTGEPVLESATRALGFVGSSLLIIFTVCGVWTLTTVVRERRDELLGWRSWPAAARALFLFYLALIGPTLMQLFDEGLVDTLGWLALVSMAGLVVLGFTGLSHVVRSTEGGAHPARYARTFRERRLFVPAPPDRVVPVLRQTLQALPLDGELQASPEGLRFKARIEDETAWTTRIVLAEVSAVEGGALVEVSSEVRGSDWRDGWIDGGMERDVDHVAAGLNAVFPTLEDAPPKRSPRA